MNKKIKSLLKLGKGEQIAEPLDLPFEQIPDTRIPLKAQKPEPTHKWVKKSYSVDLKSSDILSTYLYDPRQGFPFGDGTRGPEQFGLLIKSSAEGLPEDLFEGTSLSVNPKEKFAIECRARPEFDLARDVLAEGPRHPDLRPEGQLKILSDRLHNAEVLNRRKDAVLKGLDLRITVVKAPVLMIHGGPSRLQGLKDKHGKIMRLYIERVELPTLNQSNANGLGK